MGVKSNSDKFKLKDNLSLKEEFNIAGFFYIIGALFWLSIGFMAAYWTLYLFQLGLTFFQISVILMIYPLTAILFEIPTGAIADIYGRKLSVFLSYILSGLSMIGIIYSGNNFSLLFIFYFILGISYTFESGALESWFIETVKQKKKKKLMHKLLGRWGSFSSIGFVAGSFIGGLLVISGITKALWAAAIGMIFLSFYVLIFGKEEYFKSKKLSIIRGFKETYKKSKQGILFSIKHKQILLLIIITSIISLGAMMAYNSYQPYVVKLGLEEQYIGFALSIAGFILIFSLNYSHKIKEFLKKNKIFIFLFTALMGCALLVIGLIKNLHLIFLSLIAYAVLFDLALSNSPAFRELFNKFIPNKMRATVISVNSLISSLGALIGTGLFGLISTFYGLQAGIILGGIIIIIASIFYLLIKE